MSNYLYNHTSAATSTTTAPHHNQHAFVTAQVRPTSQRGAVTTLKSARLMPQPAACQAGVQASARRNSVATSPYNNSSSTAAAPSMPTTPSTASNTTTASSFMTQARRDGQQQTTPQQGQQQQQRDSQRTNQFSLRVSLLPATSLDHKVLLVLDMDETLLHASVTKPPTFDVNFVVQMDTQSVPVYVSFRPHMLDFLRTVARWFEVAVFTASISKYANQVLDYIDPAGRLIHHRLYREHCTECDGSYVKDLGQLGRPIERVTIIDNSPVAYSFHPENALPIVSWFDDKEDTALPEMLPTLERLSRCRTIFETVAEYKARTTQPRQPTSRRYA